MDTHDFPDQLKTIDICACGPLRVASSLINGGLLKEGSKIVMITSQGGSVGWREVQCPTGGDYGHHVSRSCGLLCKFRNDPLLVLTFVLSIRCRKLPPT